MRWQAVCPSLTGILLLFTSPSAIFAHTIPKENPIVVGNARFTVVTANCIRLEYGTGGFVDAPSLFAVERAAGYDKFRLEHNQEGIVIDTGAMTLSYKPDEKPFSPENLKVVVRTGDHATTWTPRAPNLGNLGGTVQSLDGKSGPIDLGQGLLSRDGWYLLDDSRTVLLVDGWIKDRPSTAGTDWYLFGYGTDYHAALQSLSKIGGPVPMPRKYALGAWYSRYWPYSSEEYRSIVREYSQHDFPLDNVVMDMDWHNDGWTGWSWNRKLLPDAEALLSELHQQNLHVTLNLHPGGGVSSKEDQYGAFMHALGEDASAGKTVLLDVTDRRDMDALFSTVFAPLEKDGADFWWLDWSESGDWMNTLLYDRTANNGLRGLSFSRWQGWGDHRHPIHFSGDTNTGFPMLAFEVPFTATAGNVGCFFWSHDIGGFQGGRNEESYVRWAQFGATSAAMRSHSTRDAATDRRPWKYPTWAENSMRISFHLRSELFPYLYSSVGETAHNTVPLIRAMYFDHPTEEKAYHNPQEYLLGDDLLVAPIVSAGVGPLKLAEQTVWFPEGTWFDQFTGERYAGNTEQLLTADIDEFPLFVKAGVPIPMQPYQARMGTAPLGTLRVRVFPGDDGVTGRFNLYEDDGVTQAYRSGESTVTPLSYTRRGSVVTVTVGKAQGHYKGQLARRDLIFELPNTLRATAASLGKQRFPFSYDTATFTNRVSIPARPVNTATTLILHLVPGGWDALAEQARNRRMDGLQSAAAVDPASASVQTKATEAALAVRGVGVFQKNEGTYLYKGKTSNLLFAPHGVIDGDQVKTDDGTVVPLPSSGAPMPLPGNGQRNDSKYLNFTIQGKSYRLPVDSSSDTK